LSSASGGEAGTGIEKVFEEFNRSWMTYWDAYVDLQNQLYESIKTAREVSWLAATDTGKMSEINSAQRELFSTMPRRMDYMPLGQISRDLDSAVGKIEELESALAVEKEKCSRLEQATDVLLLQARRTKEELLSARK
jgi:hypothetical protein